MTATTRIEFAPGAGDFMLNGRPLLRHLQIHEGVDPGAHRPAVLCQPGTAERLEGSAAPDLYQEHVAIYVCGLCGDYDGNPIGVRLVKEEGFVSWREMGYFFDYEEEGIPFRKVRELRFCAEAYREFIGRLRHLQPRG